MSPPKESPWFYSSNDPRGVSRAIPVGPPRATSGPMIRGLYFGVPAGVKKTPPRGPRRGPRGQFWPFPIEMGTPIPFRMGQNESRIAKKGPIPFTPGVKGAIIERDRTRGPLGLLVQLDPHLTLICLLFSIDREKRHLKGGEMPWYELT